MFELFHKESLMVEEAKQAKPVRSVIGLLLQTLIIMFIGEMVLSMLCIIGLAIAGKGYIFETVNDASQILNLLLTIGPVIAFLLAARLLYKRTYCSLGIIKAYFLKNYVLGLGIGFIMMSASVALAYVLGGLTLDGVQRISIPVFILYFIAFMVQGFNEELMMRGWFMNACAVKSGLPKAIIINSVVFAVLHLGNDGISVMAFINLILAGIVFSLFAVYFDNIIVCSAAHTMWNFAQGNIFGVLVSGIYLPTTLCKYINVPEEQFINGGAFGLEGGICVMLIELLTVIILCYLYKKKKAKETSCE